MFSKGLPLPFAGLFGRGELVAEVEDGASGVCAGDEAAAEMLGDGDADADADDGTLL